MLKRTIITTILGAIFGVVCWLLARCGNELLPWFIAVSIILSRTVMGFAIGISRWKIAWWLHGILMGAIFSLPMAFGAMASCEKVQFVFWGTIIIGIVYGFLIELITTFVFKAKIAE